MPEIVPEPIELSTLPNPSVKVCKEDLAAAQTSVPSLAPCIDAVVDIMQVPEARVAYIWEDGALMHKWKPQHTF